MARPQMSRPSNADPDDCCGGPHSAGGHSHDHSHGHAHSHDSGAACGANTTTKKRKKAKEAKSSNTTDQAHHDHVHEHSDDADNELTEEEISPKAARRAEKAQGYNYAAIGILLLFVVPVLFSGFIYVMDFLYPEAAKARIVRERVTRCYEAANPTKLQEVDKFVERYKGREYALFAQLRAKYEKYPECQYHH